MDVGNCDFGRSRNSGSVGPRAKDCRYTYAVSKTALFMPPTALSLTLEFVLAMVGLYPSNKIMLLSRNCDDDDGIASGGAGMEFQGRL